MELHIPSIPTVILAFLLFLFMVIKKPNRPKKPPGPWKLPLVGNLHNMIGMLPHHTLRDLAKKYGPLMHLQLGEVSAIIVSSPKLAEQFLKRHDLIFSARPQIITVEVISYGFTDLVFTPYGDYWRQLRKIVTLELLSTKRVVSFRYIREEEVSSLIQSLLNSLAVTGSTSPINLSRQIDMLTNDIICRAAFGKQCTDKESFMKSMQEVNKAAGGFVDIFPSLKLLHHIFGVKSKLEMIHRKVDNILNGIINDHRVNRSNMIKTPDELEEDLVDVLLRIQENGGLEFPITTENVKSIILNVFTAGTETSSTTIEWAMSELVKNPRTMEKVQAEVRQVFDGKRQIDEKDIHKLDYLKLVIKETLRLHPPGPLLPRECRDRCEVHGFEIPMKTNVIINTWAIGRDREYWGDNAERFEPERFANNGGSNSIDYKGTNFAYLPFGAGRRMCPAVSFAMANIELPLAQLLYHFDWKLPNEVKPEDLDMSESFGATIRRKSDLYLIPIPYHGPA